MVLNTLELSAAAQRVLRTVLGQRQRLYLGIRRE